jgi:hypothetical protein
LPASRRGREQWFQAAQYLRPRASIPKAA